MDTLQKTFSGKLLSPERVREIRYTPPVPVERYLVEFYSGEVEAEVYEKVYIEDRDIAGISPKDRAVYAAGNQCVYEDLETLKITRDKNDTARYGDEWQVVQFFEELDEAFATKLRESRLEI